MQLYETKRKNKNEKEGKTHIVYLDLVFIKLSMDQTYIEFEFQSNLNSIFNKWFYF